jgi:hypothetical protein
MRKNYQYMPYIVTYAPKLLTYPTTSFPIKNFILSVIFLQYIFSDQLSALQKVRMHCLSTSLAVTGIA